MSFKVILKVCVHFVNFINNITISIFVFLSILSCLYLAKNCLFFIVRAIIEDNKIDYKSNNKIKIAVK